MVDQRLREGSAVLLHLESGAYHELNPIGAVIWELLDGDRGVPAITDEVRRRVDDPPEELEEIVSGFLAELRQRDLVR